MNETDLQHFQIIFSTTTYSPTFVLTMHINLKKTRQPTQITKMFIQSQPQTYSFINSSDPIFIPHSSKFLLQSDVKPEPATMNSPQGTEPHSNSNDSDGVKQVYNPSLSAPTKLISIADALEKREHTWFVTSQIPTELSVKVQDITFNVHKYPLVKKCGYIGRLELQTSISSFGYELKLENLPGGTETFKTILKFCYGLQLDLNPKNIAPLRCAAEFLEMSEEFEDGNLITKTEAFLTFVILSSWKDAVTVLKSCENLSPWAENLQIVRRCCDSIAWKASRDNSTTGDTLNDEGWWFDDVASLRINQFMRIMTAIKGKGTKPDMICKCIMHYAERWLPGLDMELESLRGYGYEKNKLLFGVTSGGTEDTSIAQTKEHKTIIESLISILPPQQEAVSCKFLLKMLKIAMVYAAAPALISELEKRVGMMLEHADVDDLLIPSFKSEDMINTTNSAELQTMHNIDVMQRIVEYFLMHGQLQQLQTVSGKCSLSKLLDNYLAEIAKDPNLSIAKFKVLAETLPENTRMCDDGLYRAIDTYLKTHPSLSEYDRKRLCKLMNCKKLSLDACEHAAQNDRLPLRTVVQLLFSEQVKMRAAMHEKEAGISGNNSEQELEQISTKREVKNLKIELEIVQERMAELQRDYSELQQEYEKLSNNQRKTSSWNFSWKKIRPSSFFQQKIDGDEIGERRARTNSLDCKVKLKRRLSM